MSVPHLSESTEMYLKAMVELSGAEAVMIGRLAERLNVTPVSANEMVRRLGEQGLVSHKPLVGSPNLPLGTINSHRHFNLLLL